MRTFADFSNQLLALKETLKKEEIANVAGDGAVSMPPTAKKVKKRKSKQFNVSPALFDIFRRGKKKFEKWSKYLNMEDEGHRALYSWAVKNREGIIILQNAQTGEVRAIRHNRMGGGQWHKISRGITEAEDLPKKVLDDAEKLLHEHRIEKLLVVNEEGDLAGLITVKDIKKKQQYPNACKDRNGRLRVAAAVGVSGDTEERVKELIGVDVDTIVVDTAHGHSRGVLDTISQLKAQNSNLSIIAGNVATGYGAEALIDAGADCVKVGIGAGASCTTRIVAGVGVPQLTAIMDAVKIAKKKNIPVIADGGLRYSGDIAKALAAGADTIMLGSVLAGMDESPGETILYEGRQYKTFRGMGSMGAMEEGSGDRYFQEDTDNKKLVPEGIEGMVPFRGPVKNTIHQLTGGIKASMGYCGCKNIDEFGRKSEFIEITSAGVRESHPHEVRIVKEAPNYSPSDN